MMECPICNKTHNNKKYCSKVCYWKSLEGLKNEKAPNWQGDRVGKSQIHKWLDANYGKSRICEGENCRKNSNFYEWSLKKGEEYKKDRRCFLRLCRSCHRRYDWDKEKQEKAIKNLHWKTKKIRINKYGKKYKENYI